MLIKNKDWTREDTLGGAPPPLPLDVGAGPPGSSESDKGLTAARQDPGASGGPGVLRATCPGLQGS